MTDKEITKKVLLKAYSNGFKLNVNPKPDKNGWNPTYTKEEIIRHADNGDYIDVNDFIFSHEFAKAFWPNPKIVHWWILLEDDIIGKSFTHILRKKEFIKQYNKDTYDKCQEIIFPSIGCHLSELSSVFASNPQIEFLDCIKKKYRNCVTYKSEEDWTFHIQQLVLLSDNERIKYLEKFL